MADAQPQTLALCFLLEGPKKGMYVMCHEGRLPTSYVTSLLNCSAS